MDFIRNKFHGCQIRGFYLIALRLLASPVSGRWKDVSIQEEHHSVWFGCGRSIAYSGRTDGSVSRVCEIATDFNSTAKTCRANSAHSACSPAIRALPVLPALPQGVRNQTHGNAARPWRIER